MLLWILLASSAFASPFNRGRQPWRNQGFPRRQQGPKWLPGHQRIQPHHNGRFNAQPSVPSLPSADAIPSELERAALAAFGPVPPMDIVFLLRNGFVAAPILLHLNHTLPSAIRDWAKVFARGILNVTPIPLPDNDAWFEAFHQDWFGSDDDDDDWLDGDDDDDNDDDDDDDWFGDDDDNWFEDDSSESNEYSRSEESIDMETTSSPDTDITTSVAPSTTTTAEVEIGTAISPPPPPPPPSPPTSTEEPDSFNYEDDEDNGDYYDDRDFIQGYEDYYDNLTDFVDDTGSLNVELPDPSTVDYTSFVSEVTGDPGTTGTTVAPEQTGNTQVISKDATSEPLKQ